MPYACLRTTLWDFLYCPFLIFIPSVFLFHILISVFHLINLFLIFLFFVYHSFICCCSLYMPSPNFLYLQIYPKLLPASWYKCTVPQPKPVDTLLNTNVFSNMDRGQILFQNNVIMLCLNPKMLQLCCKTYQQCFAWHKDSRSAIGQRDKYLKQKEVLCK